LSARRSGPKRQKNHDNREPRTARDSGVTPSDVVKRSHVNHVVIEPRNGDYSILAHLRANTVAAPKTIRPED